MSSMTAAWRRSRPGSNVTPAPTIWQVGIAPVLEQPASAVACVLGVILIVLGRKKKPLIGYARD